MASFLYNSCIDDMARGAIDFDTDTFKVMLVTTYTANKDTHTKRSDVTDEVADGNGYTTGGNTSACTVTKDTATDKVTLSFAAVNWTSATITASAGVLYKSRGGASTDDELVGYIDFGGNVSSSAGTFSISASTITLQN